MARITVAGGPSDVRALPGEVGYIGPPRDAEPEPVEAAAPGGVLPEGWTSDPGPAADSAVPDYGSMTQAALRDEAKSRGLPVGGSKADLAARLAEHDAAAGDA